MNKTENIADAFREHLISENADEIAQSVADRANASVAASLAAAARVTEQITAQFKGWADLSAEQQFFSLGQICRDQQMAPISIRLICKDAGILPDFTVDAVPYFNGLSYVRICTALREVQAK